MRYLIIGSKGQLAIEFSKRLNSEEVYGYDIDRLDITDEKAVKECIDTIKPDVLINCAAYNNVDKAELEPEMAYKVNAYSLRNMVLFSQKYKTKIIHFSTDYVFGGKKDNIPYTEVELPFPLNKYGMSKLEGEKILSSQYENFLILRVSWLYGQGIQNFIYKLKEWSERTNEIKISTDEISVPTSTSFVSEATIKAINNDLKGLFHLVPSGFVSRYEWAKKVFDIMSNKTKITKAKQSDFSLLAKRPNFSAMSNKMISEVLDFTPQNWDYYLNKYLKEESDI